MLQQQTEQDLIVTPWQVFSWAAPDTQIFSHPAMISGRSAWLRNMS